jgi:hypothetical protein
MQEINPKVLETRKAEAPQETLNVEKFIKFGILERAVEPIPGWTVTMHVLTQDEKEKMLAASPEAPTVSARAELMKRPTLAWAITKINDESFETEDQKTVLIEKLKNTPSTTLDLLFMEYQKLYMDQYEVIITGLKKK